jgi:hypothetical protein
MIYGHNKTIHRTKLLNIEVGPSGEIVSVWFRCCALPFDVTQVDADRASDMKRMYGRPMPPINAVDIEMPEG